MNCLTAERKRSGRSHLMLFPNTSRPSAPPIVLTQACPKCKKDCERRRLGGILVLNQETKM
jgi:hypothetical protein